MILSQKENTINYALNAVISEIYKYKTIPELYSALEKAISGFICSGNPLKSLDGSLKFTKSLWYGEYCTYWQPEAHDESTATATKNILGKAAKEQTA